MLSIDVLLFRQTTATWLTFATLEIYLVGNPLQGDVSVSGELGVHLQSQGRLLVVLFKVLAAALVLEPVDVVAVSHDLRRE